MHAIVSAEALSVALKMSCANAKSTIQTLAFARIASEGVNQLAFETTDTEIHVRTLIDAQVKDGGVIAVRADLLRNVAAESGDVVFRDEKVSRGRSHYRVPHIPPRDLPDFEELRWESTKLDPAALRAAMLSVVYACNPNDVRPQARGVHVVPGSVWASDGLQMARVRIDYDGPSFVVPGGRVQRLADALATGGEIFVGNRSGTTAKALRVSAATVVLSMRLYEPLHWQIENFIHAPEATQPYMRLRTKELQQALRRFTPFAEFNIDKARFHSIALEGTGTDVEIVDRSGDSREHLGDAIVESRGTFACVLNPIQMTEALAAMRCEEIEFWQGDNGKSRHNQFAPAGGDGDEVHLVATIVR